LGLERHVVPGRSVEDALDLARVDRLVGVDPVGDDGEVIAGPHVALRQCRILPRHATHPLEVLRRAYRTACVIARRPKADEAISAASHAQGKGDCFASLAMTPHMLRPQNYRHTLPPSHP